MESGGSRPRAVVNGGARGNSSEPDVQRMPRLLTSAQAAKYLSVSERTLWALASNGEIPRVLFGGGTKKGVRYDRSDLDTWVDAHKERN